MAELKAEAERAGDCYIEDVVKPLLGPVCSAVDAELIVASESIKTHIMQ
jgi:hypothetical protein